MASRLEDLQRSFARHLRAEGRSERTVAIYGQSVRFFSAWLAAQGRPATQEELDRAAIREWLAQLTGRNEMSTVRTRHKGLQRFCGWLLAEGEVAANPMVGLAAPSQIFRHSGATDKPSAGLVQNMPRPRRSLQQLPLPWPCLN
ncbi:MAG TPA: site-specific integrase [Oryzihumus sp.]|nr:site-specific integrase [Oryzihumus sp.]